MYPFFAVGVMDVYGVEKRSQVMRAVKSQDTNPEMIVRRLLHQAGFRYRLHRKDLPGKPDLVFPGRKKIIFVHGCFWHQHSGCRFADRPATRQDYWNAKLNRNVERDAKNQEMLIQNGWKLLIIWECQTRDKVSLIEVAKTFLEDS